MKAPPAFQFYPGDYLSSSRVQAMSLAAQGAYIRLLCYQWQDGSIPDDIQKLALLTGSRVNNFETLWAQIKTCFELTVAPGRIANRRLEDTRNKQLEYRLKQVEHGKHGAEIKKGSLEGTHKGRGEGKASSSSSSSSLEDKDNTPSAFRVGAFISLWADYPNKDGRKAALKSFNASVKTLADLTRIQKALANYKAHLSVHPQKPVKNGSTWFNNWQDWENWQEPAIQVGPRRMPDKPVPVC